MRFLVLLVLGISVCIAVTAEKATKSESKDTKDQIAKPKKTLKTSDTNRGKRTLYDFGNPGYLYTDVAARRAGYENDPNSYYTHGYYNGQDAIAQFTNQYVGPYAGYPQYLEAPEPIIEIIIKDANETLPTAASQPVVTKKKKEKVHVFYVNYKKDKDNKLHLETPIASLNNDDNDDEQEEVIDYPVPVTVAPPPKSTTLRTIIHPDSEKYHSNSGIHVTFGTDDKSQSGHILEEHNAESLQHQVIALPVDQTPRYFGHNTRADFGPTGPSANGNGIFSANFQQPAAAHNFYQTQQLPAEHNSLYFRAPAQHVQQQQQQGAPQNYQRQQQQPQQQQQPKYYQQQQYQQQTKQQPQQQQYNQQQAKPPQQQQQYNQQQYQNQHQAQPAKPLHSIINLSTPSPTSQEFNGKFPFLEDLHKHAQYFVSHNQQYNKSPPQQQNKEQNALHIGQAHKTVQQNNKQQQIVFPTPTSKLQLPTHQTAAPYQPIKFRPTPPPVQFKPDLFNNYQPKQQQQQQQQQQHSFSQQAHKQNILFNRQPQHIQQPQFTVTSPPIQTDYNKYATVRPFNVVPRPEAQISQPQSVSGHSNQQYLDQHNYQQISNKKQEASQYQHSQASKAQSQLENLHKQFNVQASQGTELLKSIPKYEHHITETVPNTSNKNNYQSFGSNVIHDIPAPNLGNQPAVQVNYNSAPDAQLRGHYITASTLNSQQYVSSTSAPLYDQTQDGKKLMIVTPMPVTQAAHNQYNTAYLQQPRQASSEIRASHYPSSTAVSPFSVSNYHSDVFKQLESLQKSTTTESTTRAYQTSTKSTQLKAQLPDEVPDELREQLLSSGILENAQISVLDYDKVGGINLENLPAEHLKHFYGAGGGAQISESNRVVSVVKPNGENVLLSEKEIERVKTANSWPQKQNVNVKVVHFNKNNEQNITNQYVKADASIAPTVQISAERQYNRYLPLKINGAQFPLPDTDELKGKKIVSVVVLAPVDGKQTAPSESRSAREQAVDTREIKFLGGDLIKSLVKKPTSENFKRWLEKEARTDVELQSIVLLVAKSSEQADQEIFMYDIGTGVINKLNGELSSAFVNVAEENASAEDLEHASTLDQSALENMMHKGR